LLHVQDLNPQQAVSVNLAAFGAMGVTTLLSVFTFLSL